MHKKGINTAVFIPFLVGLSSVAFFVPRAQLQIAGSGVVYQLSVTGKARTVAWAVPCALDGIPFQRTTHVRTARQRGRQDVYHRAGRI